jgi:CRISPR/Cas system CSM-associated protein Csm3 (group 7 of RAMP superfamily)
MRRDTEAKVKISGKLVTGIPLSVGGLGEGDMVDMDLARDGRGRYYIPGASLAGPMRSWMELNLISCDGKENGEAIADNLFGYMKKDEGDREGYASYLFVEDAVIEDDKQTRERRHGIKIEEPSGTAKDKFFYTRALLPKGSSFRLEMELDVEKGQRTAVEALKLLLEALQKGEIRFGACKTRGFGTMKLENINVDYYDFSGKEASELDHWLKGENAGKRGLDALGGTNNIFIKTDKERYEITIQWQPVSKIMVKSGRNGIETYMLPLVSRVEKGVVPVIPGASIKGVLRSQADRILRTVFGGDTEETIKIVKDIFGDEEQSGRIFVNDVYLRPEGNDIPSAGHWFSEKSDAMDRVTEHEDHVAIDRFTGGASGGALYSARPVKKGISWDPIRVVVDFSARSQATEERTRLVELALLELVVRDMECGLVPLGFGTNRGMGEIKIEKETRTHFPHENAIGEAWKNFVSLSGAGSQGEGRQNV